MFSVGSGSGSVIFQKGSGSGSFEYEPQFIQKYSKKSPKTLRKNIFFKIFTKSLIKFTLFLKFIHSCGEISQGSGIRIRFFLKTRIRIRIRKILTRIRNTAYNFGKSHFRERCSKQFNIDFLSPICLFWNFLNILIHHV